MWEPNLKKLSFEEFEKQYGQEIAALADDSFEEGTINYVCKENGGGKYLALTWFYEIRNTVIYEEYNGIERYEDLSSGAKPDVRLEVTREIGINYHSQVDR